MKKILMVLCAVLSVPFAGQAQDLKISELPTLAVPLSTDIVPVVHDPTGVAETDQSTLAQVFKALLTADLSSDATRNVFIGWESGHDWTTGYDNVSVGYTALHLNQSGYANVAIGKDALALNVSGLSNTAVGFAALSANLGNNNDAFGEGTLYKNTTGTFNVGLGKNSLYDNLTGTYNVAVGSNALHENDDGHYNTGVGYGALNLNVTGDRNVALGYLAGQQELGSDKLYIANSGTTTPLIYGDFSTSALLINGSLRTTGNIAIYAAADTSVGIKIQSALLTGTNQTGIRSSPVFNSSATNTGRAGYFEVSTAASAFTLANGVGVDISDTTIGAGSAITNLYGIRIGNQAGAGTLNRAISTGTGAVYFGDATTIGAAAALNLLGANGQNLAVSTLTELTTIAAAANTDTTIQMPANSVVLAVSVRTQTLIPTAATYTVGDSGSAARFSTAAVGAAAGSTDPGTKAGAYYNASALSVRITPNLTPVNNTGRVRVTIYYILVTPATS